MRSPFTTPLTDDELYWAGLVHADGSIDFKLRRLRLYQCDRAVIEQFLVFLGQDSKISHTHQSTNYGEADYYCASTRKGADELIALGVKTEPVPELYISRHFWRGLIDGDGSVSVDTLNRPVLQLSSGKLRDAQAFSTWVALTLGCDAPKVHWKRSVWFVGFNSGKARAIGTYLYKDSYSALPRKRDVALSFEAMTFRTKTPLVENK